MVPHGGPGMNMTAGVGRGGMMGAPGVGMGGRVGGGGYGGPMMQPQVPGGYSTDINGSVQSVTAVPNPSYLPMSSAAGGVRQPAPPYDPATAQVWVHVCMHTWHSTVNVWSRTHRENAKKLPE